MELRLKEFTGRRCVGLDKEKATKWQKHGDKNLPLEKAEDFLALL